MKYHFFLRIFVLAIVYNTSNAALSQNKFTCMHQRVVEHMVHGEREIAVIIPTYNNARGRICLKNLQTILAQNYEHFHVYIIDDCSTDGTQRMLAAYINAHARGDKVTLICNNRRVGAMANFYRTIHALEDPVIVINADGDDWFPHDNVFRIINNLYENENIWLSYGQYREYPSGEIGFCEGYPKDIISRNAYRSHALPISHLRTYYAWLFKQINIKDLMYNGDFVQATCDKVMMVPMIEMSGGRFVCMQDVLYIYNAQNPISDMRVRGVLQAKIRDQVFSAKPYEPLAPIITDFAIDG